MYTWNYSKDKIVFQPKKYFYICYKLVQGFSVTGLFTGQYSAKGYDTNTDDIGAIILRPDKYNIQGGLT